MTRAQRMMMVPCQVANALYSKNSSNYYVILSLGFKDYENNGLFERL